MGRSDAAMAAYLVPESPQVTDPLPRRRLARLGACPDCTLPLRLHARCRECSRVIAHGPSDPASGGLCVLCLAPGAPPEIDADDGWAQLATAVLKSILSSHRPDWFARPSNAAWVRFWCDVAGLDPTLFFDRVDQYAGRTPRRSSELENTAPLADDVA